LVFSCFPQTDSQLDYTESSGISIQHYDEKTIENLAVLCKVWGFLKFYHPKVSMGNYDMDAELFRMIPLIVNAKSENKRNYELEKWISGFGKIKPSNTLIKFSPEQAKVVPDLDWIKDDTHLGKVAKQLQTIRDAERSSDTTNYVTFPYGASAFLWKESKYTELPSLDTGYRLAGLFRLWNSVEYYFAYKYLIEGDWNNILREFIPQFIDTDGTLGYKLAVLKLLTRLEDSHARIADPADEMTATAIHPEIADWEGKYMLPFEITFIEDKAVITDSYPVDNKETYPFRNGDVILAVNEEPVENIVKRKLEYTPASHYTGKLKKIAPAILRSHEDKIAVEYERDGKIQSGKFNAFLLSDVKVPNRTRKDLPVLTKLDNGIVYIYMGSTRGGYLPEQFEADTKGLIIDLRGYPNSIKNYWGYSALFPDTVSFAFFAKPSVAHPGLFTYTENSRIGKENPNYFKGKKVILINEYAQSHAEFIAMLYQCAPNSTLIGSKTTGSDGNISVIALPGGFDVIFTGLGVYYPDGRETQRIGILPDIEVKPTIKGIREGRDEVLEKAVEFILQDYR
jgi:hypothetical protein